MKKRGIAGLFDSEARNSVLLAVRAIGGKEACGADETRRRRMNNKLTA